MTSPATLDSYLEALASSAPTPGGGSVAGLVNALACALGEMVTALSPQASAVPGLQEAATRLRRLRTDSVAAMARDEAAYAGYIAASRLPRTSDEEKRLRRNAMQAALIAAAEAPLALARTALDALHELRAVAEYGNTHVLSDARIAALLADVAVRAGLINVRVNTVMIKDVGTASRLNDAATAIEQSARDRLAAIEDVLDARIASPARR